MTVRREGGHEREKQPLVKRRNRLGRSVAVVALAVLGVLSTTVGAEARPSVKQPFPSDGGQMPSQSEVREMEEDLAPPVRAAIARTCALTKTSVPELFRAALVLAASEGDSPEDILGLAGPCDLFVASCQNGCYEEAKDCNTGCTQDYSAMRLAIALCVICHATGTTDDASDVADAKYATCKQNCELSRQQCMQNCSGAGNKCDDVIACGADVLCIIFALA